MKQKDRVIAVVVVVTLLSIYQAGSLLRGPTEVNTPGSRLEGGQQAQAEWTNQNQPPQQQQQPPIQQQQQQQPPQQQPPPAQDLVKPHAEPDKVAIAREQMAKGSFVKVVTFDSSAYSSEEEEDPRGAGGSSGGDGGSNQPAAVPPVGEGECPTSLTPSHFSYSDDGLVSGDLQRPLRVQLRREDVIMNVIRTGVKSLITNLGILSDELKSLSFLFEHVYAVKDGGLCLVQWEETADGMSTKCVESDVLSGSRTGTEKPFLVFATPDFNWEPIYKLVSLQTDEVRGQNVLMQRLDMPVQQARIQLFASASCRISMALEPYAMSDMAVSHRKLEGQNAATCRRADAKIMGASQEVVALASYPRSGNHFLRLMIEKASGFLTGSVYGDGRTVREGYKAEQHYLHHRSSEGVLCVKDHNAPVKNWLLGKRAVHIVRNPFASVVSFANLRATGKYNADANENKFDKAMEKEENMLKEWIHHTKIMLDIPDNKRITVRYEDLVENTEETLTSVLEFLGVTPDPDVVHCAAMTSSCKATSGICRSGKTTATVLDYSIQKRLIEKYDMGELLATLGYQNLLVEPDDLIDEEADAAAVADVADNSAAAPAEEPVAEAPAVPAVAAAPAEAPVAEAAAVAEPAAQPPAAAAPAAKPAVLKDAGNPEGLSFNELALQRKAEADQRVLDARAARMEENGSEIRGSAGGGVLAAVGKGEQYQHPSIVIEGEPVDAKMQLVGSHTVVPPLAEGLQN